MTHQALSLRVETQVLIAGLILTGVYVLIIFEVKWPVFMDDFMAYELFMLPLPQPPSPPKKTQKTKTWEYLKLFAVHTV